MNGVIIPMIARAPAVTNILVRHLHRLKAVPAQPAAVSTQLVLVTPVITGAMANVQVPAVLITSTPVQYLRARIFPADQEQPAAVSTQLVVATADTLGVTVSA